MVIALYGIIFALSLLLPIGYYLFVRKKQDEPWLFALYLSVCMVNLGYLLLSLSKTVAFALFANKLAYFGQVFVPLCIFMIISKLSGFHYKKWGKYVLVGVAMLMFALVLTTGHLDWYYKSFELVFVDGAATLVKEYGPLHPTNLIYVLAYFVAMIAVIGFSWKKRQSGSQKLVGMMLAVVVCNIGGWIVEKLVQWNFEILAASYLMSEFVFFFVYWMLQDYVPASESQRVIIVASDLSHAKRLEKVLAALPEGTRLSQRQTEVLERILDGKSRKVIASELHISENTVKMHTSALYKLLNVSGKSEIYALMK